jgi:hypothetical protein
VERLLHLPGRQPTIANAAIVIGRTWASKMLDKKEERPNPELFLSFVFAWRIILV